MRVAGTDILTSLRGAPAGLTVKDAARLFEGDPLGLGRRRRDGSSNSSSVEVSLTAAMDRS